MLLLKIFVLLMRCQITQHLTERWPGKRQGYLPSTLWQASHCVVAALVGALEQARCINVMAPVFLCSEVSFNLGYCVQ